MGMFGRLSLVAKRAPLGARCMSDAARPMTRFVQYPFDKTKMAEVREWLNSSGMGAKIRGIDGVKNVEISFCPGQGWLAARYIFNDLDDMVKFLDNMDKSPVMAEIKKDVLSSPHYDS